ncbi:hypothetical protein [Cryobacterium sp. 10C3]|uniref:hypothetical protein n=1 Tax=Cryobacterium sp. 10C3 TaxID=3048577 RepID=UPI002AB431D8|nr:hypothetical protein [Cryobacterium sp. 10C3]MDY7558420.1 hypothetical protein [Cryobacterium sp. 10C3]
MDRLNGFQTVTDGVDAAEAPVIDLAIGLATAPSLEIVAEGWKHRCSRSGWSHAAAI